MSEQAGSFDGMPELLREIAEVAGLDAALKLSEQYGGTEVKIPRKVGPDHWLTRCLGRKAADMLCDHYAVQDADGRPIGKLRLYIPLFRTGVLAQARLRLARELDNGATATAAARRSGLTERSAWRMKAKLKDSKDDQGTLF